MAPFVRFVFLILLAGIALSFGMILFSDVRSQRVQNAAMAAERDRLADIFERYDNRLRKADIAVEWQKVAATGTVMESSLLIRRYAINKEGQLVPMPLRRAVVPGARVCVDGLVISFDSLFTEEFKELRNMHLAYFSHVFADTQPKNERYNFLRPGEVPDATQIHSDRVTHEEMRLWQLVWLFIQDPRRAAKEGVHVEWKPPACRTLDNGQVYTVFVGFEGVTFEPSADPSVLNSMLREARQFDEEEGGVPMMSRTAN